MKWWESTILLGMYLFYVFLMTRNAKLKAWVFSKLYGDEERAKLLIGKSTDNYGAEISMHDVSFKNIPIPNDDDIPDPIDENSVSKIKVDDDTDNEDNDKDDNDDDDDDEEGLDLSWPDKWYDQLWYLLKLPLTLPIYFTLFNVADENYEDWWPWTFFGSLMWLGGLSYLMVWWAVVVGYAWTIPQEVMGLVFLAAGTSVPELFACIIVAKKGILFY